MWGRVIIRLEMSFAAIGLATALLTIGAAPVVACSRVQDATIAALGPQQVVLVGRTGEPVPGGRAFHVERWFNGSGPATITIAFKEGEPVGDCSYRVHAGWHLVIAPLRNADGTLAADLGTLQADVDSDAGRGYIAEAERLFGPGIVPASAEGGEAPLVESSAPPLLVVAAIVGVVVAASIASIRVRRRDAEAILEARALEAERDRHRTDAIIAADRYNMTPPR